ncbi:hypothetical protein GF412_02725 [Candidatus Micrarchaeota archaeon]|nr:hypothetical protein [Candidatus Micrarchaeota archaeon]
MVLKGRPQNLIRPESRAPKNMPEPLLDKGKLGQFHDFLKSVGYAGKRFVPNPLNSDKSLFLEAVHKYYELFEEFPSSHRLGAQGLRMFDHAFSFHGGYLKIKEELGMAEERRPKKEDFEDPRRHLIDFVSKLKEELGHFPKKTELQERKLWWVFDWAREECGGMPGLRKAVGAKEFKWGEKSLKNWKNFRKELLALKEELGHEPSWTELEGLDRHDVLNAVQHHGGMIAIRRKLGWKVLQEGQEELAKLKTWECFRARMKSIIECNNGEFPTHDYLCSINESRMYVAARRFGGLPSVSILLGFEPSRRQGAVSWKNWRLAEAELRKVEGKLGYPPSWDQILDETSAGFMRALEVHHGGMNAVREKMGWPLLYERDRFPTWEAFRETAFSIIYVFGDIPPTRQLRKLGHGPFASAIKDFGGMNSVRLRLGLSPRVRRGRLSYKHWKNVEAKLTELTEKLGRFPPYSIAHAHSGLVSAIYTYHGGYPAARARFLGKTPPEKKKPQITVGAQKSRLFYSAKEGADARPEFVAAALRRFRGTVYSLNYSGNCREELEQEATLAILELLERSEVPSEFYGKVGRFVKGRLYKFMAAQYHGGVRLDRKERDIVLSVRTAHKLLRDKLHRDPDAEEIMGLLEIPAWQLAEALNAMKRPVSIDIPLHGGRPLLETLDPKAEKPGSGHLSSRMGPHFEAWIASALASQGKNEQEIQVLCRHLVSGASAANIASELDIPKTYVRSVIRNYFLDAGNYLSR